MYAIIAEELVQRSIYKGISLENRVTKSCFRHVDKYLLMNYFLKTIELQRAQAHVLCGLNVP